MRSRLIARYLNKEGYNEIGIRNIDLDEYTEVEVDSLEEGINLISRLDLYKEGTIYSELEHEQGDWETIETHFVSDGAIYYSEIL